MGEVLHNGLVAVVGRPSSGKSTFINTACQELVSITSPIPQTTRNSIRGIVNTSLGQLVLVDTPGLHISNKKFNLALTDVTKNTLSGADAVLYIIDATRSPGSEEEAIVNLLLNNNNDNSPGNVHQTSNLNIKIPKKEPIPIVVALNKCDDILTSPKDLFFKQSQQSQKSQPKNDVPILKLNKATNIANFIDNFNYNKNDPSFKTLIDKQSNGGQLKATLDWVNQYFSNVFLMSAKNDIGVNEVLKALYEVVGENPPLYSEDLYTDQDIAFRVSQVIRGEAIKRLTQEIPHSIRVDIADIESRELVHGEKSLTQKVPVVQKLWVRAFLCVETNSQKAIVIGHGAAMIKSIRLASLKVLKSIFRGSYKFDLDLQVKVDKGWRSNDDVIKKVVNNV